MQIGCAFPTQNINLFQVGLPTFKCQLSQLNPITKTSFDQHSLKTTTSSSSTDLTQLHLSNLEKLLQKEAPEPNPIEKEPLQKNPNPNEIKGRGLLEGLNLARIWPEMKAAEDMSPRNLNRLKRLLSKTEEYSPRNTLGSRWREYHGTNDWAGLLDPLDENLRREVVRYGEFVQAAYHSFHSNPAFSAEEALAPRYVALSDRSYRVTKNLYATSSVGLPKWVDDVAPDLGWMTQRSSWIGYVAVCDDKREIQRMGRRDIVISLRGTATCLEWAENMRANLVEYQNEKSIDSGSEVECGFLSLFKTRGAHVPSLAESVVEEIRRLMELYKDETLSITVTGHSLGAALALLVANELSTCETHVPHIAVFSFGGPRVGNQSFADQIEANNVKVLRIVNNQDLITRVPIAPNNPWAYSHVGTELRVDTKMSPYLKPNADVSCCHDLEAYLHLVDGFIAANCPFRANAKRSLVKLLTEQGSNVKKLYISKANALTNLKLERDVRSVSLSSPTCLPSPS